MSPNQALTGARSTHVTLRHLLQANKGRFSESLKLGCFRLLYPFKTLCDRFSIQLDGFTVTHDLQMANVRKLSACWGNTRACEPKYNLLYDVNFSEEILGSAKRFEMVAHEHL